MHAKVMLPNYITKAMKGTLTKKGEIKGINLAQIIDHGGMQRMK